MQVGQAVYIYCEILFFNSEKYLVIELIDGSSHLLHNPLPLSKPPAQIHLPLIRVLPALHVKHKLASSHVKHYLGHYLTQAAPPIS